MITLLHLSCLEITLEVATCLLLLLVSDTFNIIILALFHRNVNSIKMTSRVISIYKMLPLLRFPSP